MDKNPQYFQGVLQLRNPTQEIIDFVAKEIEKKKTTWIAKTENQKNGIDLYLSSNRLLKDLGKKLNSKFCGELIETCSLHTKSKQTGRDLYRGCILFRYYNIKKGDIIQVKGDSIKVIAIGKDILGKDILTNKKVHIKFDKLKN